LYVIRQLLYYRQQQRAVFDHGDYVPLQGGGTFAKHFCSFARVYEGQGVLVLVPRWVLTLDANVGALPLADCWQDTWLEMPRSLAETAGVMTNLFSGETLPVSATLPLSQLLNRIPVAVFSWSQALTPTNGAAP
jgi:(1->4)-alpha-D-glucan 1-alpha-D-glucosylmutase